MEGIGEGATVGASGSSDNPESPLTVQRMNSPGLPGVQSFAQSEADQIKALKQSLNAEKRKADESDQANGKLIAQQQRKIAKLMEDSADKDQAMAEKDQAIAKKDQAIAKKDQSIAKLKNEIYEKSVLKSLDLETFETLEVMPRGTHSSHVDPKRTGTELVDMGFDLDPAATYLKPKSKKKQTKRRRIIPRRKIQSV